MQQLKDLLAKGKVKAVIDALLEATKGQPLHNDVVQQAARYRGLTAKKRSGESLDAADGVLENQINQALLQLIDEVDDAPKGKTTNLWRYIVGAGVIVGIIAGLVTTLKHLGFIGPSVDAASHSVTVLVHGPKGKDDLVLPNRGKVYLIYGEAKIAEEINSEGEATFKQIGAAYFEKGNTVELLFEDPLGEPYRARFPDSSYQLKAGKYIALEVVLEGVDKLEGVVKDFVTGEPLDSVLIRIPGYSYYTNEFGEFSMDLPADRQDQFIDLNLSKLGYQRKEMSQVPTATDQIHKISLKPEQE